MKIGTKSVLFGAHCLLIHPLFVAAAWIKLYGVPPRGERLPVLAACLLHDLGYVGSPNMDGPEGERHVEWGAQAMTRLFDWPSRSACLPMMVYTGGGKPRLATAREFIADRLNAQLFRRPRRVLLLGRWGQFSLLHSRFYAKALGERHSALCVADKLSVTLEPWWLYLPRVMASGELHEYMARAGGASSKYDGEPEVGKYASMRLVNNDPGLTRWQKIRHWHARMTHYLREWVAEHADLREDTWTPAPEAVPTPTTARSGKA